MRWSEGDFVRHTYGGHGFIAGPYSGMGAQYLIFYLDENSKYPFQCVRASSQFIHPPDREADDEEWAKFVAHMLIEGAKDQAA